MKPLRVCTLCGLEANTIKDLELVETQRKAPHGKRNRCKICQRKEYLKRNPHRKRSVSRIEHLFIIECSEYMSLRAVGRRISRGSATIIVHVNKHEKSLYATGSCPWCDVDPVYKR